MHFFVRFGIILCVRTGDCASDLQGGSFYADTKKDIITDGTVLLHRQRRVFSRNL